MHLNSELVFTRYARPFFHAGYKVLEIGPDTVPSTYQRLVSEQDIDWHTADLASAIAPDGVRHFGYGYGTEITYLMENEYEIPVESSTFDIVVTGNVIEHVRRIWDWFSELARVCRPQGHVVTVCPLSWPEHPGPVDCWRILPEGMRVLCEQAGLEVVINTCDSLEPHLSKRWYAGKTYNHEVPMTAWRKAKDRVKATVGWPMSAAVDTITVARKAP
jgi:SAM-dependent methyltransferase